MNTIEILKDIDWFANAGRSLSLSSSLEGVASVADWSEAIQSCSDQSWEDVVTEAQNELTLHLNSVCKNEFQEWNEVIQKTKLELAEPWQRMRAKLDEENLPKIMADCVEWDTMHAVAREHYQKWKPPAFFDYLLTIYRSGRFPCGWIGNWPKGNLRVF